MRHDRSAIKYYVILLTSFLPAIADACSCRGYDIEKASQDYGYIFSGTVEKASNKWVWEKGNWYPLSLNKVKLKTKRVYKGEIPEKIQIFTHPQISACGYPFEEGVEYIVFAYPGTKSEAEDGMAIEGKPMVNSCSPTIHSNKVEGKEMYENERIRVIQFLENRRNHEK